MFSWFRRKPALVLEPAVAEPITRRRSDRYEDDQQNRAQLVDNVMKRTFQRKVTIDIAKTDGTFAMDDAGNMVMGPYDSFGDTVSDDQLAWYGSQSFMGFQTCAILSQNWLIDRACHIPARDYCRNGWDIAGIDDPKVLDFIHKQDKAYLIKSQLVDLVHFGRVFGIRFALPIVNGGPKADPKFYENPFNIDGVKAGTYKGIRQVDPYWVSPYISGDAASDQTAIDFYEPTWWQIGGGRKVHKSHLIIVRNGMVPDLLKPTYFYGGISIPQKIAERVYAAERTANEAPLLALSKRTNALHVDMENVMANQGAFMDRLAAFIRLRNNFGVKVLGEAEKLEQLDTSLADLSDVISGQYGIVAAASGVPITKLMGSPPKGMNATGEYDEANYHEMLESIQEHDGTPLLDRHYALMLKSDVIPKFPAMATAEVTVAWKELDAMTAAEQAEVNKTKADTDVALATTGAIDGQNIRDRLIADPASGYTGIKKEAPKLPDMQSDDEPRE